MWRDAGEGRGGNREVVGETGRTGPTHRFRAIYIFISSFYQRWRKREIERKRKEQLALSRGEKGRQGRREGSGKISAIPPRLSIAAGFSIRFARVGIHNIRDFTSGITKKMSTA